MTKKITQAIPDVNEKIVEELLSKANPNELFGKEGLFNKLKKQVVERVLKSELEHELGYSFKLGFRYQNHCCANS